MNAVKAKKYKKNVKYQNVKQNEKIIGKKKLKNKISNNVNKTICLP